jgi:leucyl/phenylalanyl-tRNA---protein transferase
VVEPPATSWRFPSPLGAPDDLVAIGADLAPGTILAGYRAGLFPMPANRRRVGWWSPNPRGILPLDGLIVSTSLRRSCRRFEVRVDTEFEQVMRQCADPRRPHGWINQPFVDAYTELHQLGWAHSVETWRDGRLVGGLYGMAIGGLFAGESMFHTETDASKVALVALVHGLRTSGFGLLDVQWKTPHLASLGVVEVPRQEYLDRLAAAVHQPTSWNPVPIRHPAGAPGSNQRR